MKHLPAIFRDFSILAGAASLVAGCWLAWRPLAFLVGGMALCVFGLMCEWDSRRKRAEQEAERRRHGL